MSKLLSLLLLLSLASCKPSADDVPKDNPAAILQDGDIIFQESVSAQSRAIQLATHSRYSHCGIIFKTADECYVYEAIQPVQSTPLEKWIKRGRDSHYVVKRLKNSHTTLNEQNLQKLQVFAGLYNGMDYDLYFGWGSKQMYCSELVWKTYNNSIGIEIGSVQRLRDFDLTNPTVKSKLEERYGKNIPYDEKVISPKALYESELLETVIAN
ncbi:YiiX family permuted papain-like enzyme [uncultured Flavobacterium sp.]|uniref:YiiX family permuted papain-like enzyme n=1 Tax=uncultured Flavobacterium sp. TaxID=165435 RepID=UPI0025E3712C|nr:YiiX family permuted papain-like enzyme [uncultured Flavobacterium sp.]